ncbi:MAG TPA: hypothetical protein VJ848_06150 [Candidatus Angelobacter sp.]|nr:hypothetical protein [Candidatus Angelobacter sp.]
MKETSDPEILDENKHKARPVFAAPYVSEEAKGIYSEVQAGGDTPLATTASRCFSVHPVYK